MSSLAGVEGRYVVWDISPTDLLECGIFEDTNHEFMELFAARVEERLEKLDWATIFQEILDENTNSV